MSVNTGLRRRRKKARSWEVLLAADKQRFMEKWWRVRVGEWAAEAGRIAGQYREMSADEKDREAPELRKKRIFSVVDDAVRYLASCGPEVHRLVGIETIAYLLAECTRVAARHLGPHLNAVVIDLEQYRPKQRLERLGPRGAP